MPTIDAVFLDLGNVLVFHDDALLFRRLSDWGGAPPELVRERMLALWDPINRGTLADDDLRRAVCAAAGGTTPMEADAFFALWNCHFRLNQELLPVVDALLAQVKVVLLSNVNALHWRHVRPWIPHFDRFAGVVLSYELRMAKPDPGLFRVALARAEVEPQVSAYFDDIPAFVEAACALGIHGRVFIDAPTFRRQLGELGIRV
jgi:FMN phosphatase YigB (HAD superfamily)